VLHYAQELFEGMKAYRGVDDQVSENPVELTVWKSTNL
jgi:branched-subunit amino acid aminotransferase/4-amino-4-deoxychorismate lyase